MKSPVRMRIAYKTGPMPCSRRDDRYWMSTCYVPGFRVVGARNPDFRGDLRGILLPGEMAGAKKRTRHR